MNRRISGIGITFFTACLFINTLFVYKYAMRFASSPWLWIICYPIVISALFVIFTYDFEPKLSRRANDALFISSVILITLILVIVMHQFKPAQIRVTRFPALHDWISRLLDGQYPYNSSARPSGFPFLFLIAVPFYLLGDLGLLQIFAFLVYAYVLHCRFGSNGTNRLRALILLTLSPVFLYEIAVRSDLFSNMVLVIAFMVYCRDKVGQVRAPTLLIMGTVGGLLLATRGIVLLIFVLYFGYLFKDHWRRGIVFACGLIGGFTFSSLPFVLWNADHFVHHGPFAIQTSYLPLWLSALFGLISIYLAARADSVSALYRYITWILFGTVGVAFMISLCSRGWTAAVLGDRFDVSYFCFTLPFLLLLFDYGHKTLPASDRVFGGARSIL
jgi:hypothetical protein